MFQSENPARKPRRGEGARLGSRLEAALTLLGKVNVLADIGCDHGKFGVTALKRNIAERVIASDISAPSLAKARVLAQKLDLTDRFEFRCCGGFDLYSQGEADAAVLLGMGGELIVDILTCGGAIVKKLERIVMQPMRGEAELREYLYNNGYEILDEAVTLDDGRYYQLISARYDPSRSSALPEFWPERWYQFGPVALKKREAAMIPMMKRYLSIIDSKLDRAASAGEPPAYLVREKANTAKLIDLFKETSKSEE